MVHVSGTENSGDAHLLEFPDGRIILIDTGFDRYTRRDLIPFLDKRGITHIDDLIITHAHRNHYEGIGSLLEHLKGIKRVYFNLPPKSRCDQETWSTGCDYEHVLATRETIKSAGVSLLELRTGQSFYNEGADIELKVVYVHDGLSPPIGETSINDTSAVTYLRFGKVSVFFSADLDKDVGAYIAKHLALPQADILTAPHHGVESAAPNEFLAKINAKVLMVSVAKKHWLGKRGDRIRLFAEQHKMPVYVTGIHGNVTVRLRRDGYDITTEKAAK